MLVIFIVKFGCLVDAVLSVFKLIECFGIVGQKASRIRTLNLHENVKQCKRRPGEHESNNRPKIGVSSKKSEHLPINRHSCRVFSSPALNAD